jgi:hypothetical protein
MVAPTMRRSFFFLIGAQKCGTTWLSKMLRAHSGVAKTVDKEAHYFSDRENYARGEDYYLSNFVASDDGNQLYGDYTPNYFWCFPNDSESSDHGVRENFVADIKAFAPDAKLILILRDPVERAISSYWQLIRNKHLRTSDKILDVRRRFGIESMGYYSDNLAEWLKYFDREKLLVLVYETDLKDANKAQTLARCFEFLGLRNEALSIDIYLKCNSRDPHLLRRLSFLPTRHTDYLRRVLPRRISNSEVFSNEVSERDRQFLRSLYSQSIRSTELLLGRSLPWQR